MKIKTLRTLTFRHLTPPVELPIGSYEVWGETRYGYQLNYEQKGHGSVTLHISYADAVPHNFPEPAPELNLMPIPCLTPISVSFDPTQTQVEEVDKLLTAIIGASANGEGAELSKAILKIHQIIHELQTQASTFQTTAATEIREKESWKKTAERLHRNEEFYWSIVEQIGNLFGKDARTADDGTIGDTVLALKVYPLVKQLAEQAEYRILELGEVIQQGDEYHCMGIWKPHTDCIGEKVGPSILITRRKLQVTKPEEPVNYRLLNLGEVVEEGDEFYENQWKSLTASAGYVITPHHYPFRRKITP